MSTEPTHVITDNPNVVPTSRDLALEAAATLAALLDLRKERTMANQKFTLERKKLEKRAEELIDEIRTGPNVQLKMHFGSTVATTRALVVTAQDDEEVADPIENEDENDENNESDEETDDLADENEALH